MISNLVAAGVTALILYAAFRRLTRPSLSKIRGPKSTSFLLGNLLEVFQGPVGEADFEWQNRYGNIARFKTVFGEDQLFVTDPKALQQILNKSGYSYPKQHNLRAISRLFNGQGLTWAEGDDHKRQRKILLPGFGAPETRAFFHIFRACAESMSAKWMEIIASSNEQKVVFNVAAWLSRAALDAMGQAAFDVQFGAIQDSEHPLVKIYNNFLLDTFGHPTAGQIFARAAAAYLPIPVLHWMTDHGSNPRLERARSVKKAATEVAQKLVQEKAESLLAGKSGRDVFSLLIKANMDSDAKNKLTDEELLSQMRTIMFAGHETTSNSLGWILLELARHPEMQSKLRAEIFAMESAVRARGDTQFTMADLDAMTYMTAIIKEGLRYHPVVPHVQRIAAKDDILPLSKPVTMVSGETTSEVIVPKGTRILVSIAAYNRNTGLWGEDAHEFNPDRWLEGVASEKKLVSVGVYSNLWYSRVLGVAFCVIVLSRYRQQRILMDLGLFGNSIVEMQTFLVETVSKFEFTMTERCKKVFREQSLVMAPTVEDEVDGGCQLPLAVSIVVREE